MPDAHAQTPATPPTPHTHASSAKAQGRNSAGGYPETVQRLIDELAKLPGIGKRSAERLAFHMLKSSPQDAAKLASAITDVKSAVRHCSICFTLTDDVRSDRDCLCAVCASSERDHARIMVVEQPKDQIALEQTGMYAGTYHVLMGRISPLDNIGPDALTVAPLLKRIRSPKSNASGTPVREVILALNPTLEGDGTTLYLADQINAIGSAIGSASGVVVTRLARGLPTGSQLEFASKAVLADAIEGRPAMPSAHQSHP